MDESSDMLSRWVLDPFSIFLLTRTSDYPLSRSSNALCNFVCQSIHKSRVFSPKVLSKFVDHAKEERRTDLYVGRYRATIGEIGVYVRGRSSERGHSKSQVAARNLFITFFTCSYNHFSYYWAPPLNRQHVK